MQSPRIPRVPGSPGSPGLQTLVPVPGQGNRAPAFRMTLVRKDKLPQIIAPFAIPIKESLHLPKRRVGSFESFNHCTLCHSCPSDQKVIAPFEFASHRHTASARHIHAQATKLQLQSSLAKHQTCNHVRHLWKRLPMFGAMSVLAQLRKRTTGTSTTKSYFCFAEAIRGMSWPFCCKPSLGVERVVAHLLHFAFCQVVKQFPKQYAIAANL